MFHTLMTLGYIIPNIYVFIRIWQLFITKRQSIAYVVIYLLVASIYPIGNILDIGFLENITDYLLPYYLYLFLFVLLTDILLLINLATRIIPFEKLKSRGLRNTAFISILILPVVVVGLGIINFNTIRTTRYQISIPGRESQIKNIRIAFLADFHLQEGMDIDFVRRYAEKIGKLMPDIILYGGDIVEDRRNGLEDTTAYEKIIRELSPAMGSYAVLGNHEHYSGHDRGTFHDKTNIRLLRDTVVIIDNLFNLAGRNDRDRKPIEEILEYSDESLPVILIDHRPTDVINISKTAVDASFSGHTHNGQMFPINLIVKSMYEISHGYRKIGNTHFFVTSGIRLWGPPVRTTGKSEIVVVDIEFTVN